MDAVLNNLPLTCTLVGVAGIVFAILYGFTGIGIAPRKREDETIPGS